MIDWSHSYKNIDQLNADIPVKATNYGLYIDENEFCFIFGTSVDGKEIYSGEPKPGERVTVAVVSGKYEDSFFGKLANGFIPRIR